MSVEATLLARIRNAPAWQPPQVGARYTWDCGCTFVHTVEHTWEPCTVCAWHEARWAHGSEASITSGSEQKESGI